MKPIDVCSVCGDDADSSVHHEFSPVMVPDSCVCDHNEWGNPTEIPEVCGSFAKMDNEPLCRNCEHEEPCHRPLPESPKGTP